MTSDCSKLDIPVPVTVDRLKAPEILYALNLDNGRVIFCKPFFFLFSAFKTRKDEIKGRKRRASTCTSSRYTLLCVVEC